MKAIDEVTDLKSHPSNYLRNRIRAFPEYEPTQIYLTVYAVKTDLESVLGKGIFKAKALIFYFHKITEKRFDIRKYQPPNIHSNR